MLCCLPDLNRNSSTTSFVSLCHYADLIIDLDHQAFSRRFPWHPQGGVGLPPETTGSAECQLVPETLSLASSGSVAWTGSEDASSSAVSASSASSPLAWDSLSADNLWTGSHAFSAPRTLSPASSDPASQSS